MKKVIIITALLSLFVAGNLSASARNSSLGCADGGERSTSHDMIKTPTWWKQKNQNLPTHNLGTGNRITWAPTKVKRVRKTSDLTNITCPWDD